MSIEQAIEILMFTDDFPGYRPERARGQCFAESDRFVAICATLGIEAEVISGVKYIDFMDHKAISEGHAVARVGDTVYDFTARQFWPHDQPVPVVMPLDQWRAEWHDPSKAERVST